MKNYIKKIISVILISVLALSYPAGLFAEVIDLREEGSASGWAYAAAILSGFYSGYTTNTSYGPTQMFVRSYLIPKLSDKLVWKLGIHNEMTNAIASSVLSSLATGAYGGEGSTVATEGWGSVIVSAVSSGVRTWFTKTMYNKYEDKDKGFAQFVSFISGLAFDFLVAAPVSKVITSYVANKTPATDKAVNENKASGSTGTPANPSSDSTDVVSGQDSHSHTLEASAATDATNVPDGSSLYRADVTFIILKLQDPDSTEVNGVRYKLVDGKQVAYEQKGADGKYQAIAYEDRVHGVTYRIENKNEKGFNLVPFQKKDAHGEYHPIDKDSKKTFGKMLGALLTGQWTPSTIHIRVKQNNDKKESGVDIIKFDSYLVKKGWVAGPSIKQRLKQPQPTASSTGKESTPNAAAGPTPSDNTGSTVSEKKSSRFSHWLPWLVLHRLADKYEGAKESFSNVALEQFGRVGHTFEKGGGHWQIRLDENKKRTVVPVVVVGNKSYAEGEEFLDKDKRITYQVVKDGNNIGYQPVAYNIDGQIRRLNVPYEKKNGLYELQQQAGGVAEVPIAIKRGDEFSREGEQFTEGGLDHKVIRNEFGGLETIQIPKPDIVLPNIVLPIPEAPGATITAKFVQPIPSENKPAKPVIGSASIDIKDIKIEKMPGMGDDIRRQLEGRNPNDLVTPINTRDIEEALSGNPAEPVQPQPEVAPLLPNAVIEAPKDGLTTQQLSTNIGGELVPSPMPQLPKPQEYTRPIGGVSLNKAAVLIELIDLPQEGGPYKPDDQFYKAGIPYKVIDFRGKLVGEPIENVQSGSLTQD